MNRLTITLDDDLYAMARAHAVANKLSLSKAVSDLLRRRVVPPGPPAPAALEQASSYFDPVLGIQVSLCDRPLTEQDIQRVLHDDDLRIAEAAGWVEPRASVTSKT